MVQGNDPDGDTMDISFYNADGGDLIGTHAGVPSDGTATVTWSRLDAGTLYQWYSVANDSQYDNQSESWSFTTYWN